jgi:uncharacterized repeat protein (TIGR02543 family)
MSTDLVRLFPLRRLLMLALAGVAALVLSGCQTPPPAFVSDDFSSGLVGNQWTVVDPLADGSVSVSGLGTADARLALAVPGGVNHEPWATNNSLRAMQRVANGNFGVEVKFDSLPTMAFQEQGVLVEQDPDNYLRFDLHSDGSNLRALAARVVNGTPTVVADVVVPATPSQWARVTRVGDQWTYQTSTDGVAWTQRTSFDLPLAVTGAGVFSGNFGPVGNAPAFTTLVDYAFNTASPIAPEDPIEPRYELATTVVGGGSISRLPELPSYVQGQSVVLLATPQPGWTFDGWSGDATGTEPLVGITVTGDMTVTGTFSLLPDVDPPVISDVAVESITPTSAVVTWVTDEPASSSVAFGPSTAYEGGIAGDTAFVTAHEVVLTGLVPASTYHFQVSSLDPAGNPALDVDRTFSTSSLPAFVSDDFSTGVLGGQWTVDDPRGDGTVTLTGAGTTDARLALSVPAGVSHEVWAPDTSLSVNQPAPDTDMVLEAKFDSVPTLAYQEQGFVVRGDNGTLLRFEVHHNGSSLRAYAARVVGGTPTTIANVAAAAGSSVWLRVARTGDTWAFDTSANGVTWVTRSTFTLPVDVAEAGVYAGNYGPGASAPAWTSRVDYAFDAASPVVPEDPVGPLATLTTAVVGQGTIQRTPDQGQYLQGSSVDLAAVPAPGWQFTGWSGDLTGNQNPASLVMSADRSVTATFTQAVDEDPPGISSVSVQSLQPASAVISFDTDELTTASVDYGTSTAYEYPAVDDPVFALSHAIPLTGLAPGTTYHFQVSATDPSGNATTDVDRNFTTPPSSSAGPVFDVWYGNDQAFGVPGLAQRWVNVVGSVDDPDGVANLSYRLNGGSPVQMGIGPDNRRLVHDGDFNADLLVSALSPGNNSVVITAIDPLGHASATTVQVSLQVGNAWPLPYAPDLGTASAVPEIGQVVDGDWTVGGGLVSTVDEAIGYDRLVAVGDGSWTDYEATFSMRVNALAAPGPFSGAPAAGFLFRWSGHNKNGSGQPQWGFVPNGVDPTPFGAYGLWRNSGPGGRLELRDHTSVIKDTDASFDLVFGQTYRVRAQADTAPGTGSTTYRYKMWAQGTAEPAGWSVEFVAGTGAGQPGSGSLVLLAHEADVDFGNLLVVPLP